MELKYSPYGVAREVSPGVARVTYGRKRTIAPQLIRARVDLAGHYDVSSTRITQPRIVAQATDSSWITWESRLLRDDEPDSIRA